MISICNTNNPAQTTQTLTYARLFSAHNQIWMMLRHVEFSLPSILCRLTTSEKRFSRPSTPRPMLWPRWGHDQTSRGAWGRIW